MQRYANKTDDELREMLDREWKEACGRAMYRGEFGDEFGQIRDELERRGVRKEVDCPKCHWTLSVDVKAFPYTHQCGGMVAAPPKN